MLSRFRSLFKKKQPVAGWVATVLRYLALRRGEDFQQALRAAPEQVASFLVFYAEEDVGSLHRSYEPLVASLGATTPEVLAIHLLLADLGAQLVERWRHYPSDIMLAVRDNSMNACLEAMELARQLGNSACVARYLSLLGGGLAESGSKRAARERYEEALAALQTGVGAVIASAHPLYDTRAARFAEVLYQGLLERGLCLGDALREARNDNALHGNPLHWPRPRCGATPFSGCLDSIRA